MLCIQFLVNLLILIVYLNLLGAQILVSNNLQSWQLHDCLGSMEFCSNDVVPITTSQIVVLFMICVIPMYVSDSDTHSSEIEIIANTCFVTVKSFALPQCMSKQTPVCLNLMLRRMSDGLHMWTATSVGNNSGSSFLGTYIP